MEYLTMAQPWFILLAPSQQTDLSTWIALTIGALALLYIFMRPKAKRHDPLATTPNFSMVQQRTVERQMESLLVELSNMTRQITAQLDTRSAKLELLIKEADAKLAELRSLMGRPAMEPTLQTSSATPAAEPEPTPAQAPAPLVQAAAQNDPDQRYADVYALCDQGHPPQEIAKQLGRPFGEIELIIALRPREVSNSEE